MIRGTFFASLVVVALFSQTPAQAKNNIFLASIEQQDALFLACMEARGYTDLASVICYQAAYGSETSGGGAPNQIPLPRPSNDCRGQEFDCSFGRPV